jgi:predicted nicotinamide N-methyase
MQEITPKDFIKENTRISCPSAIPEMQLYLADEVTPLWQA